MMTAIVAALYWTELDRTLVSEGLSAGFGLGLFISQSASQITETKTRAKGKYFGKASEEVLKILKILSIRRGPEDQKRQSIHRTSTVVPYCSHQQFSIVCRTCTSTVH